MQAADFKLNGTEQKLQDTKH